KNDISYITVENRSFIIKKKVINEETTLLALIIVKRLFRNNNDYLKPLVLQRILKTNNLKIADFGDSQNIKNIYSKDNTYLFSVKLNNDKHESIFIKIQLLCWFLATITFVILIQGICIDIAKRGYPWLSIVVIAILFFLVRLLDTHTNWLAESSNLPIFRPENYAYPPFITNIRTFIANSVAILWVICHCIYVKDRLIIKEKFKKKPKGAILFYLLLCLLYVAYYQIFHYLGTLVTHSSIIDYNFIEILKTHSFSLLFVLIYCINIVSLILLTDFILYIGKGLCDKSTNILNIQLIVLVQFLILS